MKKIIGEQYKLTLRHVFVDDDGNSKDIEQPIVVGYAIPIEDLLCKNHAIIVNEMLNRLTSYMLEKVQGEQP